MKWSIVAVVLLAGCLGGEAPPGPDPAEPPGAPEPQAIKQTFYATSDGLSLTPPAEAAMSLGWGYQQWLDGVAPPATSIDIGSWIIHDGTVHMHVRADKAVAGGDVRPELTAWVGTDKHIQHHVFIDGPDTLGPGDEASGSASLRIPPGGLYIGDGDSLFASWGTYYADGPALQSMSMLLGADKTRIELNMTPFEWPAWTPTTGITESGTVAGGRCVADVNPAGIAQQRHTIRVNQGTQAIRVTLEQTDGPTPDIDMRLVGPGGEDLGRGQSSLGNEGILVGPTNLVGEGEYTIGVYACTHQVGTYVIEATQFS